MISKIFLNGFETSAFKRNLKSYIFVLRPWAMGFMWWYASNPPISKALCFRTASPKRRQGVNRQNAADEGKPTRKKNISRKWGWIPLRLDEEVEIPFFGGPVGPFKIYPKKIFCIYIFLGICAFFLKLALSKYIKYQNIFCIILDVVFGNKLPGSCLVIR